MKEQDKYLPMMQPYTDPPPQSKEVLEHEQHKGNLRSSIHVAHHLLLAMSSMKDSTAIDAARKMAKQVVDNLTLQLNDIEEEEKVQRKKAHEKAMEEGKRVQEASAKAVKEFEEQLAQRAAKLAKEQIAAEQTQKGEAAKRTSPTPPEPN